MMCLVLRNVNHGTVMADSDKVVAPLVRTAFYYNCNFVLRTCYCWTLLPYGHGLNTKRTN